MGVLTAVHWRLPGVRELHVGIVSVVLGALGTTAALLMHIFIISGFDGLFIAV